MADEFGLEVALSFARSYGGRYLRLPAISREDHPVAIAFGLPLLSWLMERHDRLERIIVPKGPDADGGLLRNELRRLIAEGKTAAEIAARVGLHVRTVHHWKRRLREAEAPPAHPSRKEARP